ncbi:VOC family protein [Sporosarcina sp. NPDC096371]|uniref:VOC family protein n=1 Tax=Sporosarcina sp. NPDC096371 TaxID=3364530 RepID=UPI00381BA8E7
MLISKVKLYSNELAKTKDFYVTLLGFNLLDETEDSFVIEAGKSELEFQQSNLNDHPSYHFAFDIPSNQFKAAKEWAKAKVVLNREDGDDEVYFENLDAYSLYFEDPSKNIVELIARKSSPTVEGYFSSQSILKISEMSITTNDVLSVGQQLMEFGIPVKDDLPLKEQFNFMGRESSFLILVSENRRWFFSDRDSEIHPSVIELDKRKVIEVDRQGKVKLLGGDSKSKYMSIFFLTLLASISSFFLMAFVFDGGVYVETAIYIFGAIIVILLSYLISLMYYAIDLIKSK